MISFADFFRHVHGSPSGADESKISPYDWQERFAAQCAAGEPPSMICVPTGAGKTATVDALLWALAMQADRPAAERTVGARTVWAIDRRILVDQVHDHATHLAGLLRAALADEDDPLHEMAARLAKLSGAEPLVATRWRGGIRDSSAMYGPMQPHIITSTLAQVGSRLLFRGYGVGRKSLTLEAGLLGCDTTICLDEAHLAEPFSQTLAAIRRHRDEAETEVELPKLRSITLTATPDDPPVDAIRLSEEDERALGKRITAAKWASLDDSAETDAKRTARLVELTTEYLDDGLPSVACVTNTVKQARAVFDRLRKRIGEEDATLSLLIGPQRPADRLQALEPIGPLFSGTTPGKPIVCVATQTFEVGLDVDVAGLITESASAAALVQRLGRLNRRGDGTGRATIVRDEGSWLYEKDEENAWNWLAPKVKDGRIDVSVRTLDRDRKRPRPAETAHAPALTPEIIDLLVQTNPLPGPFQDPDIEPFLRGVESEASVDVSVCWRCDLRPEATSDQDDEYREMLLELVPPHPQELLTLSMRSARALLAAIYPQVPKRRGAALSSALADPDIEGDAQPAAPPAVAEHLDERPYLVIRGDEVLQGSLQEQEKMIRPADLQPGDVLVLPTTAGGIDEFGLTVDPKSRARDVAPDLKRLGSSVADASRFGARISPQVLEAMLGHRPSEKLWQTITQRCRAIEQSATDDRTARIAKLLDDVREQVHRRDPDSSYEIPPGLQEAIAERRVMIRSLGPTSPEELAREAEPDEAEHEFAEHGDGDTQEAESNETSEQSDAPDSWEWGSEGPTWVIVPLSKRHRDEGSRIGGSAPPTIARHAESVRERTREFATALGLSPRIVEALEMAARAHDHGKADPRIQAFFRRGVAPIGEEPLAKSVFGTRDPRTSRIAAELAGLPSRLHHELASAAIFTHALGRDPELLSEEADHQLCLFLIATHHGRANPIPAVPVGGNPAREFSCDAAGVSGFALGDGVEDWMSGVALERFWDVIHRYGAWGAAYLEAVLILADRTISSEGR